MTSGSRSTERDRDSVEGRREVVGERRRSGGDGEGARSVPFKFIRKLLPTNQGRRARHSSMHARVHTRAHTAIYKYTAVSV